MASIKYTYLSLGVAYEAVLEPFEISTFADFLPELGYVLSPEIPSRGFGQRIAGSGQLARKGSSEFTFDTWRHIWTIRGSNTEDITKEFEVIDNRLEEERELRRLVSYYEFLSEASMKSESDPSEQISKWFVENPLLERMRNQIGEDVSLMGIRMVPRGSEPSTSKNFYDVKIEADPRNWSQYYVQVVFRNQNKKKVLEFASKLPKNIENWIEAIERG